MKQVLLYFALLLSFSTIADSKTWEHLFDDPKYNNAKISPDGKHLAVSLLQEGKNILVFFDSETMKMTGTAVFPGRQHAGDFHWVNDERVVIQILTEEAWSESLSFYGQLYAINYNGKRGGLIYGYSAAENSLSAVGSRGKKKEGIRGWGEIADVLPEDDKHILVKSTPQSDTGEGLATLLKIDVYNGRTKRKLATSPIAYADFVTDVDGKVKAVAGTDGQNRRQLYLRVGNEWEKVPKSKFGTDFYPLSISASGQYLYTLDDYQQDLRGLFKLNLKTLEYKQVYTDPRVDITDVEMTTDGRTAFALRVDDGYPAYLLLNNKLEEAKVFKSLLSVFPNNKVNITSRTRDGSKYVVYAGSDIDPGKLYLFDNKRKSLQFLFQYKEGLNSKELAQTEPFSFKAEDGLELNGLFTQAKRTKTDGIAPLVVLVHGGPHGIRDFWGFSSQVQYLAQNGYSVLRVNYRGSGGFGLDFELAGHQNWGSLIQQDILQAYQWAIANGKAEAGNACIMGASFGGYSAVQSVTKYPDVYKCAVANAGIYDLELMFDEGDVQKRFSGRSYLRTVLGTDEEALKSNSPVHYVEKIKVPLFLAHGERDERAPVEHVERLKDALDEAKKDYEWYVLDKEGHGFSNEENQKRYMKQVITFLNKNLSI